MSRDRRLTAGFFGFVLLGMPYAGLGVAWPSMADDLGRSLGDLGFVLVATTVGYALATAANGWLTHRVGSGLVLPVATALGAVGLTGWAAAESIAVLVAAAVLLGAAGGSLDAGVNAYVATRGSTRTMGWLHATFGVGSTIGPILATEIIDAGISWRAIFVVLAVAQAAVSAVFVATRRGWPDPPARTVAAPRLARRQWMVLGVSLAAFALYTGVEVAAGEWSFSLFTEGRDAGLRVAGYLVTGYWAMFTAGRIALGIWGDRLGHGALLRSALIVAAVGAGLFWWAPAFWVGAAGLILLGLGLAPLFPVLVLVVSDALGAEHAPWAVGYQIAAASVGAAVIPAGIGAMVAARDITVAAPIIGAATAALLVTVLVVLAQATRYGQIATATRSSA